MSQSENEKLIRCGKNIFVRSYLAYTSTKLYDSVAGRGVTLLVRPRVKYTPVWKKGCILNPGINDGQCDTLELWEDSRGKLVPVFCFLIFKYFLSKIIERVN